MCQRSWVRAQTCSVVNKISFKAQALESLTFVLENVLTHILEL